MSCFTRHTIHTHNQNTDAARTVLARGGSAWFAPAGVTYLALPANRGVYDPRTASITMVVAKNPPQMASSPRLFGKRHVQTDKNVTTVWS